MFKQDKSLNQRQKNRAGVTFFIFITIIVITYTTLVEATACNCFKDIDMDKNGEMSYKNPLMGIGCNLKYDGIPDCNPY